MCGSLDFGMLFQTYSSLCVFLEKLLLRLDLLCKKITPWYMMFVLWGHAGGLEYELSAQPWSQVGPLLKVVEILEDEARSEEVGQREYALGGDTRSLVPSLPSTSCSPGGEQPPFNMLLPPLCPAQEHGTP